MAKGKSHEEVSNCIKGMLLICREPMSRKDSKQKYHVSHSVEMRNKDMGPTIRLSNNVATGMRSFWVNITDKT